uniref:Uncharacterized protein n=1 Tax=Timema cristinae TaxID=61476 RepID=A0A7R9CII0_TIMCR|nr:unnamed protein product [Timema cristinae]
MALGRVVLTTLHPLFANVGTSIAINSRLVGKGAQSGLKLERRQPNVIKVVWDPTRSEQEKLHKTAPLLLSFDLDKKSLPGQVLKSIPDVLKERVSIKKIVDGFMKDPTKQLQALELSLKHNFLSQLTAFYAVKLKD